MTRILRARYPFIPLMRLAACYKSILDLRRRDEHNPSVSPLRNRIACAPVIADSLLHRIPDGIENSTLKRLIGNRCRLRLSFGRNVVADVCTQGTPFVRSENADTSAYC